MMRKIRCWPVLALAALTTPASALDVFPLSEGLLRSYEYVAPGGTQVFTTYFAGTELVAGIETQAMHFNGGTDDGLQQFWSESQDGDKYLHGWYRSDCQCDALYSPPILWIDMPLEPNKTWDVTTQVVGFGSLLLHFRVTAVGPMTVPAGEFDSFTIEWYTEEGPPTKAAAVDPSGRWLSARITSTPTSESYADAVGLIRSAYGSTVSSLLQLETVDVEALTWTRIRELYR